MSPQAPPPSTQGQGAWQGHCRTGGVDSAMVRDQQTLASPNGASFGLKMATTGGYPYLGVEIGGGMAAAYNHRTHMTPEAPRDIV